MMLLGRSSLIPLASLLGLAIIRPLMAEPRSASARALPAPTPGIALAAAPAAARVALAAAPAAARVKERAASQPANGKSQPKANRGHGKAGQPVTPVATLPGFHMLDGGESRVYVELTGHVDVVPKIQSTTLVFTLKGVRVPCGNNRNPLLTTHFATPVSRIQLVPHGADVDLIIDLRTPAGPTHRVVDITGTGGMRVEVDFPSVLPTKGTEQTATGSVNDRAESAQGAPTSALPSRDEPLAAPAPAER